MNVTELIRQLHSLHSECGNIQIEARNAAGEFDTMVSVRLRESNGRDVIELDTSAPDGGA